MSRTGTALAMLLFLGLFLVGTGIALMMANETRPTYTYISGIRVLTGTETVYPYADAGVIMILAGITALTIGLIQTTVEDPTENNEADRPQIVEQEPMIVE